MPQSDEEFIRRHLSDAVRARILDNLAKGKLPPALADALGPVSTHPNPAIGASLESMVPLSALEAIVRLTGRPPLLVKGGAIILEPLDDFPLGTDAQVKALEPWLASVGRVEFHNHSMAWGGTGWVIRRECDHVLIVTNRHVAALVARRAADGSGVFLRSAGGSRYGISVDFGEEVTSVVGDRNQTLRAQRIDYLADNLEADVALLRVVDVPFKPSAFELATSGPELDQAVALIGYPAYDSRNDAAAQAQYFRDIYEVKRVAPGFIIQKSSSDGPIMHDCTSLGGNSGSPLICLETQKVVGLHFAGVYGRENSAVSAVTLQRMLDGERLLVAVPVTELTERADGHHPAAFFADREGYDPLFLGDQFKSPWPLIEPGLAEDLAKPSDAPPEPNELRYTHFGVKYSATLKIPLMTAVNIDGGRAKRIKREGDQWFTDGRIESSIQLGANHFKDREIDRGHMVRREDPNWGTEAEATRANFDTFHYVNAAPQHSRLNQGKQLWQGLENYILDNARTYKFCANVFAGPVISEDDPQIDGAHVPLEFWKLVVTKNANGDALRATAYLLSQGQLIRKLLEDRARPEATEGVELGAYRTFQISVSDLAAGLGYDFSDYVAADPLARNEEVAAARDAAVFIPLDNLDDMVL